MSVQPLVPIYPPAPLPAFEVLDPDDLIEVWVSAAPFAPVQSRELMRFPVGTSIEEMVRVAQPNPTLQGHTLVWVNSEVRDGYVDRYFWARVRPRRGTTVYIQTVPNDDFRTIGLIAILALAIAVPFAPALAGTGFAAGTLGGGLLTAGLGILGSFAFNALVPPPNQSSGSTQQLEQVSRFQTFRNTMEPWGLFERVIGTVRIYPKFLAEPYTDIIGQEEWKRMVFAIRGPVQLSDYRFGNRAAERIRNLKIRHTEGWPANPRTFAASDVDLNRNRIRVPGHGYLDEHPVRFKGDPPTPLEKGTTYWVTNKNPDYIKVSATQGERPIRLTATGTGGTVFRREPRPKIYPGAVFEQATQITLAKNVKHIFTTQPETDDAKVLFFFPEGLGKFDDKNPEDLDHQTVQVQVRWRKKGTATWTNDEATAYPARNSRRIPRPVPLRERIDQQWTEVPTLGVYAVYMNPWNGDIEVGFPARSRIPDPNSRGRPQPGPSGERGATEPNLPPFPSDRIPIARVYRTSFDNDRIEPDEIVDVRPPVSGLDFPRGARFLDRNDFRPRPTSPRSRRIRVRRGTIKLFALDVRAKKREQFFRAVDIDFPEPGEYEIEIARKNDAGGGLVFDRVDLVGIQSFTNKNILDEEERQDGISLIEVKVKAQDNLEGAVDAFNFLATSYFETWDGTSWEWGPTNNIAECVRGVLQGTGNINPVPTSRLVLDDWQEFAEWCADKRYTCGQVVDFPSTVREIANDLASCARGTLARVDLNIGVTIDRLKSQRVTLFARHNMQKGSFRVDLPFVKVPHFLRVRFRNERQDYAFDEVRIYGDGFSKANHDPAKGEVLSVPMITRPGHAKEYARYRWLDGKWRQKSYTWTSPLHGFAQRHGDLNGLNHDAGFLGLGSAQVVSVTTNAGNVETVTLSTPVNMEIATSYSIQWAQPTAGPPATNRILTEPVNTAAGEQSTLTLTTPTPIADAPAVDDMLVFGEVDKEAQDVLVSRLSPVSPYRTRFECRDLAPQVFAVDGETFDETASAITIPPDIDRPVVIGIFSDESAIRIVHDGSVERGIRVTLKPPQALTFSATRLEAQIREKIVGTDEGDDFERESSPWDKLFLPFSTASVRFTNVRFGVTYEMRFRYRGDASGAEWVADNPTNSSITSTATVGDWVTVEETVKAYFFPPPDVTDLSATLDELRWIYDRPVRVLGFRVRVHYGSLRDWNTALRLTPDDQLVRNSPFQITDLRGTGQRTLLIKAVDVDGQESVNPGSVRFDFGEPALANVVLTNDYHPAFSGTISGGTVIADVLQATDTTKHWIAKDDHPYWKAEPTYRFWTAASEKYDEMTYDFSYRPTSKGSLSVALQIEALDGYKLEIRKDKVALFWRADPNAGHWLADPDYRYWDATPGQFFPLAGSLDVEVDDYTIRLTTFSGTQQAKVTAITATLDVPDITERLTAVSIAATGTRLSLTETFTVITQVEPSLIVAGTAVRVDVIDKDPTLGPLVVAVAGGGAQVPATSNFIVHGYRRQI